MAGRDMEALAIGIREAVEYDHITRAWARCSTWATS
jgi:tryptophanase